MKNKRENKKETEKEVREKNPETEEIVKKNTVKQENKQLRIVIIFMVIVLLILGGIIIFVKSNDNFYYGKLKFQKTKVGSIRFYTTNIPIVQNGQIIKEYPINFREDPRKSDDINVNISGEEMVFAKKQTVYISIGSVPKCSDNLIAVVGLTAFLTDFGGFDVKGAMLNKTEADENKMKYVTCKTNLNNTVIEIIPGAETSITQTAKNCYEIKVKDCDINKATEKFTLRVLEGYMNYFDIKKPSFLDRIKTLFS